MNFYISKMRHSIEFFVGRNVYIVKRTNHAHLQGDANYWFPVIDNRYSAVKYFFHYSHGPNLNNCNYFKIGCPNCVKAYIFGMYTPRWTIWYFIHVNRTLLKIWPHLTFGWPFANISLTIHQRHSKLYIFVILKT